MSAWSARQLAALGAVAATVLLAVGFVIPGNPPKFNRSAQTIVLYFHSHHGRVLAGSIVSLVGVVILIAVLAHLAIVLRGGAQRTLASVATIASAAVAGLIALGVALYAALAQLAYFPDGRLALAPLYRLEQFLQTAWFWTALPLVVATAIAGLRGVFPRWSALVYGIVAVVLVLGGISVKALGALQAGTGGLVLAADVAFLVYLLVLGYLFWVATPYVAAAQEPAPAAP